MKPNPPLIVAYPANVLELRALLERAQTDSKTDYIVYLPKRMPPETVLHIPSNVIDLR